MASIIAFGPGRIGVAWTNQRSGVHFSAHEDGAPDDAWSPAEAVLPGSLPDQQLNLTTFPLAGDETSVAAAVATTHDRSAGGRTLDALTLLATRAPDATWTSAVFGLVRDRHARPIVLVDPQERTIAVAATSPGSGGVISTSAPPWTGSSSTPASACHSSRTPAIRPSTASRRPRAHWLPKPASWPSPATGPAAATSTAWCPSAVPPPRPTRLIRHDPRPRPHHPKARPIPCYATRSSRCRWGSRPAPSGTPEPRTRAIAWRS